MSTIEQAIALRAEARSHVRMSRWHRTQAKRRYAELEEFCRANGIDIQIVVVNKQGQEDE